MGNPYFKFKQFTVWHNRCAMKVGTDGVLLGAWAPVNEARRVLDIGTGTGLVALMLAQRCSASIMGVEVDEAAAAQARDNVAQSPWADRIHIVQEDFNDYWREFAGSRAGEKFDAIVSNPPYFTDSLRCPDSQRTTARHTDLLTYETLIAGVAELLSATGVFSLVIPVEVMQRVTDAARACNLFPFHRLNVITKPGGDVRRVLMAFRFGECVCEVDELLTEIARHQYSDAYIALTKEYYLHL